MSLIQNQSRAGDILLCVFLYVPVAWFALLLAQSLGSGLPELLKNLTAAMQQPLAVRWTDKSLVTLLICTVVYAAVVMTYVSEHGRTRDGAEHGSAAWAPAHQVNAMFAQKQNILLTKHVRLGLDAHKHRRNLNVLVIGGSGASKTRGYVKPNILEANTNYVITDPKMEVLTATGGFLKRQGYDIRVLNLVNMEQSDGYNPFVYLRDEKDALKLVNNLIQSTTPKGSKSSDPFWEKSETALLQAIILMLFYEAPSYEQNFSTDREDVIQAIRLGITAAFGSGNMDTDPRLLQDKLMALSDEQGKLIGELMQGAADAHAHDERLRIITAEMEQLRAELREQKQREQALASGDARLKELFEIIDAMPVRLDEYDDSLVKRIVERVTVKDENTLTILFDGGYSVETIMAE